MQSALRLTSIHVFWLGAVLSIAGCRKDATAVDLPACGVGSCPRDAGATPQEPDPAPPADGDSGSGAAAPSGGAGGTGGAGRAGSGNPTDASTSPSDAAQEPDADRPPLPDFTLEVDAPSEGDSVRGVVTVRGRAPAFKNVEVWDAMNRRPPLAQATPLADSTFTLTIDVGALTSGATTWTVYAWDSAPGETFQETASVSLNITIAAEATLPTSCAGQTCSGRGSCSVTGSSAACSCEPNYRAVGLSCVPVASDDGAPDPGTAYVPGGYLLSFSDEFEGSTLDTGKWNTLAPYGVQFFGDSKQKQAFVPEAVTLDEDVVTFTAQRATGGANGQPYSSGAITTNQTFTHGYFEARVKVPAGKGLWPAYWLTSSERWPPEWDIFEIIDDVIFGYTHPISAGKCTFVEGAAGGDSTYQIPNLYGTYHVYGFHWTETDLHWYVDGVLTEHYAVDAAAGSNDPFWLNLSLQVGGDWPGDPDSTTQFPARMDIDYVRVYQVP